jgi:hypothetical protein
VSELFVCRLLPWEGEVCGVQRRLGGGVLALGHKHRGRRNAERDASRTARQYCFNHGKVDSELQEILFTGKPEDVLTFVETVVPEACLVDPENFPQGLVLVDNHGTGAFQ